MQNLVYARSPDSLGTYLALPVIDRAPRVWPHTKKGRPFAGRPMNGLTQSLFTQSLLCASFADHLHIGDVQIAVGFFAGRVLHLAFFLFFRLGCFMRECGPIVLH